MVAAEEQECQLPRSRSSSSYMSYSRVSLTVRQSARLSYKLPLDTPFGRRVLFENHLGLEPTEQHRRGRDHTRRLRCQ